MTFILISSCSIASGNKVQVSFTATAPAASVTSYSFGVSTSANATLVSSNSITNTSTPPILAIGNATPGANRFTRSASSGRQRGPHGGHSRTGAHRQLLADLHCQPTHDRLGNQRCRVLRSASPHRGAPPRPPRSPAPPCPGTPATWSPWASVLRSRPAPPSP